jgi:hypothetical protein
MKAARRLVENASASEPPQLLVQDTTEVDLSHHPKTKGLSQVGNERGRAFSLRPPLCMLGIVAQRCFRSAEAGLATQTHFLVRAAECARRGTARVSAG